MALIDKAKKAKKVTTKKKKKQDGLGMLTEKEGAEQVKKDYANTDMMDVLSPSRLASKKK